MNGASAFSLRLCGGHCPMTTQRLYALPVDITHWHFDGATEVLFNWEYDDGSADLLKLYEKGKQQQWHASSRIDWSQDLFEDTPMALGDETIPIYASPTCRRMTASGQTSRRSTI